MTDPTGERVAMSSTKPHEAPSCGRDVRGHGMDVAGAVARLLRDTDRNDPAYEGIRRAYAAALDVADPIKETT